MAIASGAAAKTTDIEDYSRAVDTPELITRLAEDLKDRSGSDLPLSCFIEQVRMQLAGGSPADLARAALDRAAKRRKASDYESSDCFKAWAMPD
jgi:hypothetical protein